MVPGILIEENNHRMHDDSITGTLFPGGDIVTEGPQEGTLTAERG